MVMSFSLTGEGRGGGADIGSIFTHTLELEVDILIS